METIFRHWIKKKVIVTFYLTILNFFLELRDISSQLLEKNRIARFKLITNI